jgi:hypothetical protein
LRNSRDRDFLLGILYGQDPIAPRLLVHLYQRQFGCRGVNKIYPSRSNSHCKNYKLKLCYITTVQKKIQVAKLKKANE